MKVIIICALLINSLNCISGAFPNIYPKIKSRRVRETLEEPLILTPYLEQNKIQEARSRSEVHYDGFDNVVSFSGYFTVNKLHNSNQFFWFFPAENSNASAPVVLWLQGGPGASSLYGLFNENGPFKTVNDSHVALREERWTIDHSMIYIDNPVGTGYSFTDDGGYCQNQTQVGQELHNSLQQFFQLFAEFRDNDFYITGESYAGKYIPALAHTIHKSNTNASLGINLQGVCIGNGLTDPVNQVNYADYLYQIGLIDTNEKVTIQQYEQAIIQHIQNGNYRDAFNTFDALLNGDKIPYKTVFANMTDFSNYFNFLIPKAPTDGFSENKFVQNRDVRAAIHVGHQVYSNGSVVEDNLMEDVMKSVADWMAEAINNYRVLIYNGQLDIIVAYPLTVNYLRKLQFHGADEYKRATRQKWFVGNDLAGYVHRAGNLTEVLVRNAGHMVPSDQPKWAHVLISNFTHNQPLQDTSSSRLQDINQHN